MLLVALLVSMHLELSAQDKPAVAKRARQRAAEPATAEEAPRGKLYVYKHSAGKPRQLELYFPPGHDPTKAKVPGLILFHGGGWSGGTLAQFRTACDYFARRGLVCATAEYQMLSNQESQQLPQGETKKRVCITDAKSAIRWFKQHADELGVDPQRIVTGGGSAGGHLAVLATTNPGLNDPADSKLIDTRVVAYLLFNPAFALDDSKDSEVDVTRFLRRDLAPAVVFFGTEDKWKEGWDIAHAKLKRLDNTTTDLQLATGRAHGFFNKEPWRTVTLIAADRFLAKLGLLAGEPTLAPPATGEKLISAPAGP